MSILAHTRFFVSQGVSVFPVYFRGKKPVVKHWEPYKDKLPSDNDLRAWFPSNLRNYAVVLGWQNLAVLDFDEMQAWYDWNLWAIDNCRLLDNAYTVKTSRGMHLYFSLLEPRDNLKLPGIDFKTHGYVIGPGSTHPTGHIYEALSPWYLPIVERLEDILPAELLEQAVSMRENYTPIAPVKDCEKAPGVADDIWAEAEQAELFTGSLSIVDTIKARWKVENFFPGVKPDGKWLHVLCPFHDDKEPSAWVNLEKQLFGCHSCNMKPMTVIGLYAALYTQGDIKKAMEKMR
jgi:hypothetical protein